MLRETFAFQFLSLRQRPEKLNSAAHIAEDAQATGSTLRAAALKAGHVTQEQYDKTIIPRR